MATLQKRKTDMGGKAYTLTLPKLTEGELMAITRALTYYNSPVSQDVLAYIQNAIYELNDEELTKTISDSIIQLEEKMKHSA